MKLEIVISLCLAAGLHVFDWLQTRWISVRGPDRGLFELNPILGPHPSLDQVNNYFLWTAVILVFLFASHALLGSIEIARFVLLAWAAVELWAVINNLRLRVGVLWSIK